jgi:hypothetical protein
MMKNNIFVLVKAETRIVSLLYGHPAERRAIPAAASAAEMGPDVGTTGGKEPREEKWQIVI